jgi:hypothetical protein
MGKRRHILWLPLLLVLAAASAQEPADPTERGPTERGPIDPNQPAAKASGQETGSPPPQRAKGDSPFDYEASEQISEDLSVSFPIDI